MFVLLGVVPSFVTLVVAALLAPPIAVTLVVLVFLPYVVFMVATLHISDYVSYRDVFHAGETLAPLSRGGREIRG